MNDSQVSSYFLSFIFVIPWKMTPSSTIRLGDVTLPSNLAGFLISTLDVAFILPLYSIFFLIFTLANISFPTSSNFIGEMLLFLGIFRDNFILGTIASLSMF